MWRTVRKKQPSNDISGYGRKLGWAIAEVEGTWLEATGTGRPFDHVPDAFERLSQRLLRMWIHPSGGYNRRETVVSTERACGLGLINFQVVFQCKRYSGTVSAGIIEISRRHDWTGGRGLIISTGTFSRDAREAILTGAHDRSRRRTRIGGPPQKV
jgi:hypothetical protein